MRFENSEVWGFEHAIRGMRNPMNSHDKSDSCYLTINEIAGHPCDSGLQKEFVIGENDLKLMQKLICAGSEHRKFLRQIFVSVDITAPLYWWKEFDTYKVGTVANSTSTMHKIHAKEFMLDDFSHEHLKPTSIFALESILKEMNYHREKFLQSKCKDKTHWWQMIQLLPSSYNQKRTITMNYENILTMYRQRKGHKLNEWSGLDNPELPNFISWVKTLPYAEELILIDN